MTIDLRFTKREVFIVDIGGNQLLLPVEETSFELIKTLVSSTVYSQSYTETASSVYHKYGGPVTISLREVTMFDDPNSERQYESLRKWDQDCIAAKELAQAIEEGGL